MLEEYEEWEVRATKQGKSWDVSDGMLPAYSKESCLEMCELWHQMNPEITYVPVGFKCTRKKMK